MEWLTQIFNNPLTPWIIASALVGGTFSVAMRWWWHGRCLKLQIDQIRSASGVSAAFSIRGEAERWNYYTAEKFEAAKEGLLPLAESEPLARQTLAYLKRCEPVQEEGSDRWRLETAVAPVEVIRLSDHLMERDVQVSLFRAFPNYLVGVGLCITFLGLAVVIGNASSVLTPGGSGDSSLALRDLLVAASSKFWSSLAAVSCSILYGIWFRNRSQHMERVVSLLARDLGRCVRVISSDELHYESIQRLRRCEEYQSITANGIGLLEAGLESTQSSSAEQHRILLEKLEAVADGLAQKFSELGNDIGKGIAGGVGREVTKEMKETAVHMRDITEEFRHLTGKVKEQSASIAANFSQASGSAKDIETNFKELPALADPLKQAALLLHHGAEVVGHNIGKIVQENENVVTRWQALADLVMSVDEALGREIASLNSVFPPYSEKLKEFSERWEKAMIEALGGLKAEIKELATNCDELRTQRTVWRDSSDAVARSVDAVNEHVTRFTEALAAHGEAQMLALQRAASTDDPLLQDAQDSASDAEKTPDAETISTTTPV